VSGSEPPAWLDELEASNPSDRPELLISSNTDEMVTGLEKHMARLDPGLFQRGRELVTVLGADAVLGVADGTPVVRTLTQAAMLRRVTRHVQFMRMVQPKARDVAAAIAADKEPPGPTPVKCAPPAQAVLMPLIDSGEWPNVRLLRGITETPLLRADGSILQEPGYDVSTQYLYCPSCKYLQVEPAPTQAQGVDALARLRKLFEHFPFTSVPGAYVGIAAALTAMARPAIDGPVPTFVFEASVRGSGKTLQCDVVHLIATGRSAPHAEWPADEDEQKKTLNSLALSAAPIIVLDNVKGLLGGATLEGTLTSERVSFRVLGTKNTADIPWQSLILASGNNLQLSDDMIRRVLVSRLEPAESDPTTRRGLPDLPAIVRSARIELVRDALTVLRTYTAHGRPDAGAHLATFMSWASLVANAIMFSGGPNVCDARPSEERAQNDDVAAASVVVDELPRLLNGSRALTLKQVVGYVYPAPSKNDPPDGYDDMRDALETLAPLRSGSPDVRMLGIRLRKFVGRWFGDARLVQAKDTATNIMRWSVEKRQ
jgi:putative DNA primase/helicase